MHVCAPNAHPAKHVRNGLGPSELATNPIFSVCLGFTKTLCTSLENVKTHQPKTEEYDNR